MWYCRLPRYDVRGKQFCYDESLLVPRIIRRPKGSPTLDRFRPGTADDRSHTRIWFQVMRYTLRQGSRGSTPATELSSGAAGYFKTRSSSAWNRGSDARPSKSGWILI